MVTVRPLAKYTQSEVDFGIYKLYHVANIVKNLNIFAYICSVNINRDIFRIAAPAIVSNITVPLLGLADTTISGHLGSEKFIAAIAVGSMMINVVLWCFGFLRSGTSGLTAQAYGAKDPAGQHELFSRSVLLGLFIGLAMIILQWPLMWLLLNVIDAEPAVSGLAPQYFRIIIWGAPAMLATMAVSGWFLGMQSGFYPMVIAILTNVVNIGASLLLVYEAGLGFPGTALGTTVANWFGLVLALLLARRFNGGQMPLPPRGKWFVLRGSGRFFRVSSDIFLRSLCIMAVSLGMTAFGARIGSLVLAVNAVMMQFFLFFSYFMDGFAFAAEALTGKAVGRQDDILMRSTKRALGLWAVGMAVSFTAVYYFFWHPISTFITPETDVLQSIGELHLWLILMPAITVAAFIYDGIYIGLTATRLMFVATASGAAVFYIFNMLCSSTSDPIAANSALWASFLSYLLIRGAGLAALCPRATRLAMAVK